MNGTVCVNLALPGHGRRRLRLGPRSVRRPRICDFTGAIDAVELAQILDDHLRAVLFDQEPDAGGLEVAIRPRRLRRRRANSRCGRLWAHWLSIRYAPVI
jgi:hypothetical protein